MFQAFLPVFRNQPAMGGQRINVAGKRERHHIGINAVDHRAGLFARATMRLLGSRVWPVLAFQYLLNAAL